MAETETEPLVRLAIDGELAELVLDRPAKLNAMNAAMVAQLQEALAAVARRYAVPPHAMECPSEPQRVQQARHMT